MNRFPPLGYRLRRPSTDGRSSPPTRPALVVVIGLSLVGCGSQPGVLHSEVASGLSDELADQPAGLTAADDAALVEAGGQADDEPGSGPNGGPGRIGSGAPAGPSLVTPPPYAPDQTEPLAFDFDGPALAFGPSGAYRFDGGFRQLLDGPVAELVGDGDGGVLFQRELEDRMIWWLPAEASEPQQLLVTDGPARLILEGVVGSGPDRQVLYQWVQPGGPPDNQSWLRTYRFADAGIRDVIQTGGWEWGTDLVVVDGQAVGTWGDSGSSGYFLFDLSAGRSVIGPLDHRIVGMTAPREQLTIVEGRLLRVGPTDASAEDGSATELAVSYVTEEGAEIEQIALLPWAGEWAPTSVYATEDRAVVSRRALDGDDVLGPLVIDLATGDITTLGWSVTLRPL